MDEHPVGLPNLGNTCFLNAARQTFRRMFGQDPLLGLTHEGWVRWWADRSPGYHPGHQDDAQSVLSAMLEEKQKQEEEENNPTEWGEHCEYLLARRHQCACPPPAPSAWLLPPTAERFLFVALPADHGTQARTHTFRDLLGSWQADCRQPVPTTEKCPQGSDMQGGEQVLVRAPRRFWIVHVNRYSGQAQTYKRPDTIEWPHVWEDQAWAHAPYRMVAGIIHHGGSMHSGHYTAVVRGRGRGHQGISSAWFWCNDGMVTPLTEAEAQHALAEAYVVVYDSGPANVI